MADTHIHIHLNGGEVSEGAATPSPNRRKVKRARKQIVKQKRKSGAGLPKKYAKMGFKKGWKAYKKTPAYKKKKKKGK